MWIGWYMRHSFCNEWDVNYGDIQIKWERMHCIWQCNDYNRELGWELRILFMSGIFLQCWRNHRCVKPLGSFWSSPWHALYSLRYIFRTLSSFQWHTLQFFISGSLPRVKLFFNIHNGKSGNCIEICRFYFLLSKLCRLAQ